jgi:hypothetical protein
MSEYRRMFKGIDFDRPWSEEDWEVFFQAQEGLSREVGVSRSVVDRRGQAKGRLPFREVLRRFGMDPDDPTAAPREFDLDGPGGGPSPRRYWQEDADVETLPLYRTAREYACGVLSVVDRRFFGLMTKTYKSEPHRRLQRLLEDLQHHARLAAASVAAGHELGYYPDTVKGNIARCRRAFGHAEACLGLVTRLRSRRLPAADRAALVRDTVGLRNDLDVWIAHLRERFC